MLIVEMDCSVFAENVVVGDLVLFLFHYHHEREEVDMVTSWKHLVRKDWH